MKKLRVGILGATGMVGQRFITLLENHPWFELVLVAASPFSRGKTYQEAVVDRWKMSSLIPKNVKNLIIMSVEEDMKNITNEVDFVFSALDLDKEKIREIENSYAARGIPVVSNNSAHRWTEDVPMIMPEVNYHHLKLIDIQRENRGWIKGFIAVKPNCSIQSYVSILSALKEFKPLKVTITSLQAISGAGKTFESWPEMIDNVIPFIKNEEEKSEKEPLKIWGRIKNGRVELTETPQISATCIRVPVTDGHMASVSVLFETIPTKEQILQCLKDYDNPLKDLCLPSSPAEFIKYYEEDDRPQTKLDRDYENGMGITMGRLRKDSIYHWKFIALSHNTIRGAAGGAILLAELLKAKGYL
ncbi:aspartate-semialdehyde dehydrogenase [Candidatus Gottesmanbacteria bacterium RIFCSPLOWO2_01_FULL_39_12b]|uniref:Aspartate-semialdehyde dehydrogenase n=1 Tax=Candidatus Gottesmanbacteria bacterium RIFCSPLOWO2_01_FULL_39_12b TaxID=1798388 RepID=A0A1F6AP54_9BACT|nr:MAG: aspartate-semialdehyde dehydrogenase [Candidatus Gottesmanbacteria bacterium RIFCSPLOWO2_01_FULL_39_12b]